MVVPWVVLSLAKTSVYLHFKELHVALLDKDVYARHSKPLQVHTKFQMECGVPIVMDEAEDLG